MAYVGTSNEIAKGRQDVIMTELGKFGKTKVKISIRSDEYKLQCWARVYVWSTESQTWNIAWHIEPSNMDTVEGAAYMPTKPTRALFEKDRDTLLTRLAFILS